MEKGCHVGGWKETGPSVNWVAKHWPGQASPVPVAVRTSRGPTRGRGGRKGSGHSGGWAACVSGTNATKTGETEMEGHQGT